MSTFWDPILRAFRTKDVAENAHDRLHGMTSALDHAAADAGDYNKLVATNPTTGAIEFIAKSGTISTIAANEANVGSTPTVVHSFNMPANTLESDGKRVEVLFSGISANNSNVKTIAAYFGSNNMVDFSNFEVASSNKWFFKFYIVRTSSTTARVAYDYIWNKAYGNSVGDITEVSFSVANRIELLLTGVASADITAKLSITTLF
jgi:hypothetical protein